MDNIIKVFGTLFMEYIEKEEAKEIWSQFVNMRAYMWWIVAGLFRDNKVKIPDDPELKLQLCTPRYEIKNGKIKLEAKEDIKLRLGRSSDRADNAVQLLFWNLLTEPHIVEYDDDPIYEKQTKSRKGY